MSVPDNDALDVGDVFSYELWVKRGALQGVTQRLLHKGGGVAALGFGLNNKIVLLPGGTGAATPPRRRPRSPTSLAPRRGHQERRRRARLHRRRGPDRGGHHDPDRERHRAQHRARDTGSAYASGDIDEVAIYPTALSPARVLAHYQAGRG